MPNIMIVDQDDTKVMQTCCAVREIIAEAGYLDKAITTVLTMEPIVTSEELILYGFNQESLRDGELYALEITKRAGIKTRVVFSSCWTISQHIEWAGFLALYATVDRMEAILEKLKGKIDPGLGVWDITTFDVEKHFIVPGEIQPELAKPYIKVIASDAEDVRLVSGALVEYFPIESVHTKQIAGFICAGDME